MERLVEVTALLQAARVDMKVGQLISGEAFSLFEAMSALEAGNPKMDAAASPAADRPTLAALLADLPAVAPLPTGQLEGGAEGDAGDGGQGLGPAGLLAVLDGLLAMEASWHNGGSAMQTVYSCLYMLRMDRIKEANTPLCRALYAYCRALQCDCAAVRDLIYKGGVCEEEDMNIHTSGIPFDPRTAEAEAALPDLEAAIAETTAAAATAPSAATATAGAPAASSSGAAVADSATARASALASALVCRLRLRRALHLAWKQAGSDDPAEVCASAAHLAEARTLLATVRETSALATQPSATASSSSSSNGAGAESSTSPPGAPAASESSPTGSLPPGFYVDANRHLLGPAPPRQVQVMSLPDALSYFERMLEHLQIAVLTPEQAYDYRSLQMYLWRFARMRPGVVARSLLHLLLIPDRWQNMRVAGSAAGAAASSSGAGGGGAGRGGGRKGAKGGKGAAAAANGNAASATAPQLPAWVPSREMVAGACQVAYKAGLPEEVDLFLDQAVIAVSNWCQSLLMNRCRCRRRLRRCLDDWLNMYHHGFNADLTPGFQEHLQATGWRWLPVEGAEEQGPLSTWVEYETAATMLHHLLMGFELELYEPREYDMIVWYCDYLCSHAVQTAAHIAQRAPPRLPPPQASGGPAGGRGLGGRGGGRGLGRGLGGGGRDPAAAEAAMARYQKDEAMYRYEVVELEVIQLMCAGLLRLMVGLRLAGSIPEPPFPPPFNDGVQRFDQRFSAFYPLLRPAALTHGEFVASMDPGGRDARFLMTLAGRSFAEARARCAGLKAYAPCREVAEGWVKGLERAAALNQIVSGVLAVKVEDGGKVAWTCDWSAHAYFPAVSLPKATPTAKEASAAESKGAAKDAASK